MPGCERKTSERVGRALVGAVLTLALSSNAFSAERSRAIRIGPVAGSLILDEELSNYRWDTSARAVWGVSAALSGKRHTLGARFWRSTTSQSTGIPGVAKSPTVNLTGSEATGEFRLARFAGFAVLASGSLGLLHVGYAPDRLVVDLQGGGETLAVDLEPLDEALLGVGLAIRRNLARRFELALGVHHSWFGLETNHRVGDDLETRRETFGNWTVRVELSHRILHF